jgi:hypothetical protein
VEDGVVTVVVVAMVVAFAKTELGSLTPRFVLYAWFYVSVLSLGRSRCSMLVVGLLL